MAYIVFLFAATVIVSLQCGLTYAEISNSIEPNNRFKSYDVPGALKKLLRNHVRIIEGPPISVEHHGEPVVLECVAHGSPAPTFAWFKNGELISDIEEESNEIFISNPTSIAQMQSRLVVTYPTNGDVYTCLATSGVKQHSASTTIFTAEDFQESSIDDTLSLKPVITASYIDILQKVGTNVLLPCRAKSYGKYQLEWKVHDRKITHGNSKLRLLPSGDLLLMGLGWKDMGSFECTVKNEYGTDRSDTFLYPYK